MEPADKTGQNGSRRTQAERRGEAEQRLLLAARQIVARKGWVGMTLSEVGEEAGYSRGLATHHFGSKAGLLRALAAYVNSNFMRLVQVEAPKWRPGLDALKGFISVYLGRNDSDWVNSRALLSLMAEAVTQDSETAQILAQYNRTVQQHLADCIGVGIANGEIRADVQPLASAVLILGTLRGSMLQYLLDPGGIDMAALHRQLLDLIDAALAA
ncbi:HTH-type transcriptional regulator AcrR [compost metagenome]|jgi:AcrR family transcriptional regulator|uniref:TetR/AcrR family transcriptional regulator n=1 Tax=Pseudomonas TaxID=286 RepID=UPI00041C8368|nr:MULTISPECIES: TetR/AcrR family transcriptional regulator [Pseudomonas]MCW2271267.1 AcrR family transcriptional regulator [Pseudomonas sp. JUb96]PRA71366.1 TetR/AcrR family transcriptional regulator [Pseudomonas sp. MYb187]